MECPVVLLLVVVLVVVVLVDKLPLLVMEL
jgi:hypothetical protein